MLEKIFGTRSKVRILRELSRNPERDFSLEDIVKNVGMSYGTVHPAIKELADARIVLVRKAGGSKLYKLNKVHVLYPEMVELLKREVMAFRDIAGELADNVEKRGIENIILFGSVARGDVTEAGDIDLLIIYSDPEITKKVDILVEETLDKYDVVISPLFLSKKEVVEKIKNFDSFILDVIDEGEVIYGDAKWLAT